jgi:hypothetical protein
MGTTIVESSTWNLPTNCYSSICLILLQCLLSMEVILSLFKASHIMLFLCSKSFSFKRQNSCNCYKILLICLSVITSSITLSFCSFWFQPHKTLCCPSNMPSMALVWIYRLLCLCGLPLAQTSTQLTSTPPSNLYSKVAFSIQCNMTSLLKIIILISLPIPNTPDPFYPALFFTFHGICHLKTCDMIYLIIMFII